MDFSQVIGIKIPESDYSFKNVKVRGETDQQTYSGEQLLTKQGLATPTTDSNFWATVGTRITITSGNNGWANIEQITSGFGNFFVKWGAIDGMTVSTVYTLIIEVKNVTNGSGSMDFVQPGQSADPFQSFEVIEGASSSTIYNARISLADPDPVSVLKVTTKSTAIANGLRFFTRDNVPVGVSFDIRTTVLLGDHSTDWQNYYGDKWQPYVGGIPAPNPSYPQDIKIAHGHQEVTVSAGGSSTTYPVDLQYFDLQLAKVGDYQDVIFKNMPTSPLYDPNVTDNAWCVRKEVAKIASYNGETVSTTYKSTTGQLTTGAEVYYGVAPTSTVITDASLISQLDALYNAGNFTIDSGLSISTSSTDAPSAEVRTSDLINDVYSIADPNNVIWSRRRFFTLGVDILNGTKVLG